MNFTRICRLLGIEYWPEGEEKVIVDAEALKRLIIKAYSKDLNFDEDWYRDAYDDIDKSLKSGDLESGYEHFLTAGFFENRLPSKKVFDPDYYYKSNEDLQAVFSRNDIEKLFEHYLNAGVSEGRASREEFERL